jgi:hypothetical protein
MSTTVRKRLVVVTGHRLQSSTPVEAPVTSGRSQHVACPPHSLPILALEDQDVPPSAARGPVALAAVPDPPGTPACRSALGRKLTGSALFRG